MSTPDAAEQSHCRRLPLRRSRAILWPWRLQERIAAEGFDVVLADVSGIQPDEPLAALVREHYRALR